ncbi:hypothetical protein FOZ62_010245, partial [Perkinsus olseni]
MPYLSVIKSCIIVLSSLRVPAELIGPSESDQESSIDLVTFMQICEALFHDDVSKFPGTTEKELKKIYYQTQAIKTKARGNMVEGLRGKELHKLYDEYENSGGDEGAGAAVEESQECKNEQDTGDAQPVVEDSGEGKEEEAG